MSIRAKLLICVAAATLCGCASDMDQMMATNASIAVDDGASMKDSSAQHSVASSGYPEPVGDSRPSMTEGYVSVQQVAWGEPTVMPSEVIGPQAVADTDGPYLLDTGDRLRIFVYGQPNLSRQYTVDHEGRISVPLIGNVTARGRTTGGVQASIRDKLGAEFVKDPQVTVDVQQNRPFFIYGEVKTAGQYPYVSGMTVETAIAIAGGYSERASDRKFRLTRRVNGFVEQIEAPGDYVVKPGDTVYVFERFF